MAASVPAAFTPFTSYLDNNNSCHNSFALFLTDAEKIAESVRNLNYKSSYGFDCVPMNVMKQCISQIAEPLSILINSSFRTGLVPDKIKVAKVCPIFKDDDKNVFSNYRPISILPSFSKIFEKAVYNRLSDFVNTTTCQK